MKLNKLVIMLLLALLLVGCGDKNKDSNDKENEGNKNLYCEEGTLKDGKCEVVMTTEASYTCESGYTLKDNTCTKTETNNATSNKVCGDGYTLSGNQCISNANSDKVKTKVCEMTTKAKEECPTCYAEEMEGSCWSVKCYTKPEPGKKCNNYSADGMEYTIKESCPSGTTEIGGKCKKTSSPKTEYSCGEGELSGKKCVKNITVDATPNCEDEYSYNKDTKKCEKINLVEAKEKE